MCGTTGSEIDDSSSVLFGWEDGSANFLCIYNTIINKNMSLIEPL